ncbi:MAG: tetratricopeptide repeat protein [Saprospiraceae bacterium]
MRFRLLLISSFLLAALCATGQTFDYSKLVDSIVAVTPQMPFEDLRPITRRMRRDSSALELLRVTAQKEGNCTAESFANDLLGKFKRNASSFDAALVYHDEAVRVAIECRDTTMISTAHNGRGVVFRRQDMVAEAMDAHITALEIGERVSNPSKGLRYATSVALNSLGNIYLAMERWDDAEREFLRSMTMQDSLENPLGVAINNQNLGYVAVERNQLDKALKYFEQSLSINEEIDSDFGRVLAYIAIADTYAKLDRADEGLSVMNRVLPIVHEIGDPYHTAQAAIVMGSVLQKLDRLPEAQTYFRQGMELAIEHDFKSHQVDLFEQLGQIDSLQGNFEAALTNFHRGRKLEREFFGQKNQRYVGGLSAKLETARQRAEIQRLAQENELFKERSRRTQILLFSIFAGVLFLIGLFIVLSRQRKIIYDRDLAHLEQQRLASQMNPHFLFNALNSIKAFLIDNERDSAISYLDTFAQLVRRILQSSIDETVSLAEELENCKLYVRIENARLNNEVDFNLNVDPSLDLEGVQVPPLLLQPFLENAFWHGLQSKEGQKQLDLIIENASDGSARIRILDNGIGRFAAEKSKEHRVRKRKSIGVDITRKRLDYYAKQAGKNASFKTFDLIAPDGEALGTEVIVELG